MDIVKAAGVGAEITLGGRTFKAVPIRLRQLAEFTAWAQARLPDPIKAARNLLASELGLLLSPDERKTVILEAYEQARGAGPQFGDPILSPLVNGVEGRCYELWLSLRQHHGDEFKTHEDLMDFIGDNLDELMRASRRLSQLNQPEGNSQSPTAQEDGRAESAGTKFSPPSPRQETGPLKSSSI